MKTQINDKLEMPKGIEGCGGRLRYALLANLTTWHYKWW